MTGLAHDAARKTRRAVPTSGGASSAWRLSAALAALALAAAGLSLVIGRSSSGPTLGFGGPDLASIVVTEIRLPRTLLALLVGGTLGLCGAALQGLLRNPLAEPGLLGASSGAAFGAVLVFYFGLAGAYSLALPAGGVAGSLAALAVLYALAGKRGDFLTIVLAGIAINAFAAALTSLALNFAPSPYAALEILFWMLGSLADRSLAHVALALPLMVPGWLLVIAAARGLDALTLGEETAASLGFDARRVACRTRRVPPFTAPSLSITSRARATRPLGCARGVATLISSPSGKRSMSLVDTR